MIINEHEIFGLIGPVVAVRGKNGTYLRSRPTRGKFHPTPAQQQQFAKMEAVQHFIAPVYPFLKTLYVEQEGRRNCYNALVSWLLSGAFDADNVMQPCRARLCHGSLTPPEVTGVEVSGMTLHVAWNDNTLTPLSRDDDHLVCLLYEPLSGHYEGHELNTVVRSDTQCTLLMNAISEGFYLYLAFINSKRNRISDSVCVGCESERELHVI